MKRYTVGRLAQGPIIFLIGPACFLLAWSLFSSAMQQVNPAIQSFAPSPLTILKSGKELAGTEEFWIAAARSNLRVLSGFAISATFALPLALSMAGSTLVRSLVGPITDFLRYVPVAALIPLCILWFGIGESLKISVLFLGTFFQLVVMIYDSLRRIPPEYIDQAQVFGASALQSLTKVVLPAAGPAIYDSLRVAMSFCWSYLMMAEIVAPEAGLGHIINYSQRFLRAAPIYAVVIFLGSTGLIYDQIFVLLRPRIFPWTPATQDRSS